jgi:hypothetical protein
MEDSSRPLTERLSHWYQKSGQLPFIVVGVGVILFLLLAGSALLRDPAPSSMVGLMAIAWGVLRIGYELTLNHGKVPTFSTGFADRRTVSAILAEDAGAAPAKPYVIVDLGSGAGAIAAHIARSIPKSHVIGIEGGWLPFLQSMFMKQMFGPGNLEHRHGDFMLYDCSHANAVYMYLNGRMTKAVGEKLARELKPGTLVVTHTFGLLGEWVPIKVVTSQAAFPTAFNVYRKP